MFRNRNPSTRGAVVNDTALSRGRPERHRGYTLAGWWEAGRKTLNVADVATLTDQSGNAHTLAQATGANQPLWVASGQNGKPCVRFTAANSDNMTCASTNLFGIGPYTVFLVMLANTGGAVSQCYFSNDTSGASTGFFLGLTNGNGSRNINHTNVATHIDSAAQTTTVEIWSVRYVAGSGPVLALTGTSTTVGNASTSGLLDPGGTAVVGLGSRAGGTADFADVDIYECIAFAGFLNTSANARATSYLRARYGV